MRWILDDGSLDILASLPDLSKLVSYPAGRLCVAPATAEAARQSDSRTRLLGIVSADGRHIVERFEIVHSDDDPAGGLLLRLRVEVEATANQAEFEAIAWAAVRAEDTVFVSQDKRAAFIALAELGRPRVAHPYDLWIDLLENDIVSIADFQHLCEQTRRKEHHDKSLRRLPDRVSRLLSEDAEGELT